jgi:peptidoglycan hydrolase-like protein with peptidoglycan-binding domain
MSKQHRRPKTKRHLAAVGTLSVLVCCGVVAATLALAGESAFLHNGHDGAAAATLPAGSLVNSSLPAHSVAAPTHAATPVVPQPPSSAPVVPQALHLLSTEPPTAATAVDGGAPITLTFDAPIAADAAMPVVTPTIAGTWTRPTPSSLQFLPTTSFTPDTAVSVAVPASLASTNGGTLSAAAPVTFTVADGSLLGLQQLLAQLDYLPVTFTSSAVEAAAASPLASAAPAPVTNPGEAAFRPESGDFAMRFPATPTELSDLWSPGQMTTMTKGAIMAFENLHGLKVDGIAGPQVWSDLIADADGNKVDPQPYTWAWTTMTRPEMLQIWSNGSFIFSSLANTGIPAAPTPHGSWPVFARYRSQTMRGTNPNGTKYDDPGVPYISYFNGGDAIHGFRRGSYGSQQSLGCVELPYSSAATVWGLIDYGTIVTVT